MASSSLVRAFCSTRPSTSSARFLAGEFALALLHGLALDGGGGELVVELVEEGSDVRGLRGHLRAGGGDDVRIAGQDVRRC